MGRVFNCLAFDLDSVEAELKAGHDASVQFDKPFGEMLTIVDPKEDDFDKWLQVPSAPYLERLDAMCAQWGDRLGVRFYDFWGKPFDAALVGQLPNVRNLSVDSLWEARNLDAIARLEHLSKLHLGVFNLDDKTILGKLPIARLSELILSETNTKALDLAPLANAAKLRRLYLAGHHKNIASLTALDRLQEFTFNAKKGLDLSFINGMANLRALKFNLGGTASIADIQLPKLEDIAFTMVRNLVELGDMQRFPSLRRLFMQDQQQLESACFGPGNTNLEHLWFYNCQKLDRVEGLADCNSLKSLRWIFTDRDPASLKLPKSLTHLHVLSGKRGAEAAEKARIEAMGYVAGDHGDAWFFYK